MNLDLDDFLVERRFDREIAPAKIPNKGSDKLKELLFITDRIIANF